MSTVIQNEEKDLEEASSDRAAPKHVLKNTYDMVLAALNGNKKVVLITGNAKKGKTALLHTISKDISSTHRIINLSGRDLPSQDNSKSNVGNPELSDIQDFIVESTALDDALVVTLDDADHLPLKLISALVTSAKNSVSSGHNMQLILSAPLNYKEQLLKLEELSTEDVTHLALDSINEEEIHAYAKNKTYKISSNIKRLEFKPASLQALADFIQSDQQILDVVLEWCAALAKKDQLTSVTPHTVNRAAGFAKQFSKDKNLRLANSYPPSHEVYKYINDIQADKKSSTKVKKKSVKKPIKNKANKPFINTAHKADNQATKIPVITSKAEQHQQEKPVTKVDKEALQSPTENDDEIMPTQWTKPARGQNSNHRKPFPAMAGLLSLVVIGFITFIAYRIGSEPEVTPINEASPKEQVAQQSGNMNAQDNTATTIQTPTPTPLQKPLIKDKQAIVITEPNLAHKKTDSNNVTTETPTNTEKVKQIVTTNEKAEKVTTPHAGIIASDTKSAAELTLNSPTKKLDANTIVADTKLANNSSTSEPINDPANEQQPKTEADRQDTLSATTEINGLLALAEQQFKNKQMSTPPGDNSLETYQKILAKYPNNEPAISGIKKLHNTYVNWANYYLQRNEVSRAKNFYNKALAIDPNDTVSKANLENIAQQEATGTTSTNTVNAVVLQDTTSHTSSPRVIQSLLATADLKMQQIDSDIGANKRNYKVYQEAQSAYQNVLKIQPQNQQAKQGLASLKNSYADWAELQIKSRNYNIALFLYGQALSIAPGDTQISQRIEQIRQLKNAAL